MSTEVGVVRGDAAQRAERAWQLRIQGRTWRQVAEAAGYGTPEGAIGAVKRYCGELPRFDRQHLRDLWRERLEELWSLALDDAREHRPGAVVAGVRVGQLAAQLDGLSEAQKVDLEVTRVWDGLLGELTDGGYLGS
jgi:hypothetical protein